MNNAPAILLDILPAHKTQGIPDLTIGLFCFIGRCIIKHENYFSSMNKPIPTTIHGVLDYLSVLALLTLPCVLKWNKQITALPTGFSPRDTFMATLHR